MHGRRKSRLTEHAACEKDTCVSYTFYIGPWFWKKKTSNLLGMGDFIILTLWLFVAICGDFFGLGLVLPSNLLSLVSAQSSLLNICDVADVLSFQWRHMNAMATLITGNTTVCLTVCLD